MRPRIPLCGQAGYLDFILILSIEMNFLKILPSELSKRNCRPPLAQRGCDDPLWYKDAII